MSRVAVFGAGYVGLVTGACFAELGHDVVVRDVVPEKVEALRAGRVPIHEPGLEELIARNRERLRFTLDVREAIEGADFVYVCVDTPPTYSGDADLSRVWTVVDELPADTSAIVVMKSTVPVGTGEKVRARLDRRGLASVGYASNPEFTAEGTAVRDFMEPDRIVVGAFDPAHGDAVEALHAGIDAPVVRCDVASAEMIKLAANAALMMRVSFINEIANVCEVTGADVVKVAEGVGLDRRVGPHFLRAGIGYGGSCLLGDETVLVRRRGRTQLVTLERLYEEAEPGDAVEILTWRPGGDAPEFLPVQLVTRRWYEGDIVEVRTQMGRRVRATADHPFVTRDGRRLAEELTGEDWLPIALGAPRRARRLAVRPATGSVGGEPGRLVASPHPDELAVIGPRGLQDVEAHGAVARAGALRLEEAVAAGLDLADASLWRVVGLDLAERRDCCEQRLPDAIWDEPEERKRALLAGFWLGGGSWSYVQDGPGVVLECGTASRELADGLVRLLGELGVVARLQVGRRGTSTRDTYRLVIAEADQVEQMLDLVSPEERGEILRSLDRQRARTAPAGYRRSGATAWVRVVGTARERYRGFVYSLEVPPVHTFVTTAGLAVSNCFPKDSLALKQLAANSGYHFQLLNAVIEVNELQKRRVIGKLTRRLGTLRGKKVALLGLAFKPDTDDMREAPSLVLAGRLLAEGADVTAWDPIASPDGLHGVVQHATVEEALDGADAAVLVTEWSELRHVDWAAAAKRMRNALLIDGRNMLDPDEMRAAGFVYEGIGRAANGGAESR